MVDRLASKGMNCINGLGSFFQELVQFPFATSTEFRVCVQGSGVWGGGTWVLLLGFCLQGFTF